MAISQVRVVLVTAVLQSGACSSHAANASPPHVRQRRSCCTPRTPASRRRGAPAVAFLIAGCDEHGHVLYHTDTSGTYFRFEAWAIGAGSEGTQSLLQEKYSADMSLADAEALALSTLKQVRAKQCLRCWGVDATCAFVA
jgi:Proteasome subunit